MPNVTPGQAIIIVHEDGSRRILELKDTAQVIAASVKDQEKKKPTEEDKANSFVPSNKVQGPKKRFVRTVKQAGPGKK